MLDEGSFESKKRRIERVLERFLKQEGFGDIKEPEWFSDQEGDSCGGDIGHIHLPCRPWT